MPLSHTTVEGKKYHNYVQGRRCHCHTVPLCHCLTPQWKERSTICTSLSPFGHNSLHTVYTTHCSEVSPSKCWSSRPPDSIKMLRVDKVRVRSVTGDVCLPDVSWRYVSVVLCWGVGWGEDTWGWGGGGQHIWFGR